MKKRPNKKDEWEKWFRKEWQKVRIAAGAEQPWQEKMYNKFLKKSRV